LISYGLSLSELKDMDQALTDFVNDNSELEHCGIVDAKGTIIYNSNKNYLGLNLINHTQQTTDVIKQEDIKSLKINNREYFVSNHPIFNNQNVLLGSLRMAVPTSFLNDDIYMIIRQTILYSLIAFFLFSVVIIFIIKVLIVNPLRLFIQAVEKPGGRVQLNIIINKISQCLIHIL